MVIVCCETLPLIGGMRRNSALSSDLSAYTQNGTIELH